jgi:hypothetical protein
MKEKRFDERASGLEADGIGLLLAVGEQCSSSLGLRTNWTTAEAKQHQTRAGTGLYVRDCNNSHKSMGWCVCVY